MIIWYLLYYLWIFMIDTKLSSNYFFKLESKESKKKNEINANNMY